MALQIDPDREEVIQAALKAYYYEDAQMFGPDTVFDPDVVQAMRDAITAAAEATGAADVPAHQLGAWETGDWA